jgi:UDP-N-acetylglucosamine 2-epimerase (non-hydrolysing)
MTTFILGTTAETIKVVPILGNFQKFGKAYRIICTEQHPNMVKITLKDFGCNPEKFHSIKSNLRGLKSVLGAPLWILRTYLNVCYLLVREKPKVVIVHGDTLTTLVGGLAARSMRKKLVHVEAGYRTNVWFSPMPEELVRRLVSKLAHFHLAPGEEEYQNLLKEGFGRSTIVNTQKNTGIDNLLDYYGQLDRHEGLEQHILVTLHRSENISNSVWIKQVISELQIISQKYIVRFVTDERSKKAFSPLLKSGNSRIIFYDKMNYFDFIQLLVNSMAVITDSGGLQQECAVLGVPTLIHRSFTESKDGVGKNILISENRANSIVEFVEMIPHLNYLSEPSYEKASDLAYQALLDWGLIYDTL